MSLAATQLGAYLNGRRSSMERRRAVWARLARRKRRGDYLAEVGRRAFRPVVDEAARAYVAELGVRERWSAAFPASDRDMVARELERDFRRRYRSGELDLLLPKKLRPKGRRAIGNPIRRGYSRPIIAANIRELRLEGKTAAQATAIALDAARKSWADDFPGAPLPPGLGDAPKKRTKKKARKKKATKKKATKKKATKKKRATKKKATKKRATKKKAPKKKRTKKKATKKKATKRRATKKRSRRRG